MSSAVLDPPEATAEAAGAPRRSLDQLMHLEIPVSVSFGEREVALRDLATLGPGSLIELDRSAVAPVDLLINGRCVARGELLVVEDQYALRLTEVISTGERILTLSK